jgi:putative SOS response-associated peptidase YedK
MKDIHERMPVILDEQAEKAWLNPRNKNLYELSAWLKPYDASKMKAYRVSSVVNMATNEHPDCIKPV